MSQYVRAKKSLGQHFLTCPWVISDMCRAAHLSSSDTVLEIGPGTGVLTRPLAARVKKVIAIEKDERLCHTLARELALKGMNNVTILNGDILTCVPILPAEYKIVASIPYYLTARLLRLFLEQQEKKPNAMVLTIQKEVAQRITAQPPNENLLALSIQVFGTPRIVATVPASCFSPKPWVDSAIISISDISDIFFIRQHIKKEPFFQLLHRAFAQKRKMLTNTLSDIVPPKDIKHALQSMGAPLRARPQELSKEQWALLAAILQKIS